MRFGNFAVDDAAADLVDCDAPFDNRIMYFSGFTSFSTGLGGTPWDYAYAVNPKVKEWLKGPGIIDMTWSRLGVINVDFMDRKFCDLIIRRNFATSVQLE